MSSHLQAILFRLIRIAIGTEQVGASFEVGAVEWPKVYEMARKQGVLAVVFDGLAKVLEQDKEFAKSFPRDLKLRWIMQTQSIEQTYARQLALSAELAERFAESDIATVCLKGLAVAKYYPVPSHRECGDLDCFLMGDYERGNLLAEELGAKVEREFYKHSHIIYKGLMVENHQFCTAVRGSKLFKARERHLQNLLKTTTPDYIADTKLISPCCDFNALFLTTHGFGHFLTEGIRIRHILDWVLFVKSEQANIDWKSLYEWCDRLGYTRYLNTLNAIAVDNFGLELCAEAQLDRSLAERLLNDCHTSSSIFNQSSSPWRTRFAILRSYLSSAWKYHKVHRRSILVYLFQIVKGFIFEREPKL